MFNQPFRLIYILLIIVSMSITMVSTSALTTRLIVTNTNDSGIGSLRLAIEQANANDGLDIIEFHINDEAPQTIKLQSELPYITDSLMIDATTQTGTSCNRNNPTLRVELSGEEITDKANGLTVWASNVTIRGLVINQFSKYGIEVVSPTGENTIYCNFVGTDTTGIIAKPNRRSGIQINHSPLNTIGSFNEFGNLISGNQRDGLVLLGSGSANNVVIGNRIGTTLNGLEALPNKNIGLFIDNAPYNYIGGADDGSRNIISGNGWEGIYINDSGAYNNVVAGNFVGTDINGTTALGNTDSGIVISGAPHNLIGGTDAGTKNIISANGRQGILIFLPEATANRVIGNIIGADVTGTTVIGNSGSGILLENTVGNIIGGDTPSHHNFIAGNREYGIHVVTEFWSDNEIMANFLGDSFSDTPHLKNILADFYHAIITREDET